MRIQVTQNLSASIDGRQVGRFLIDIFHPESRWARSSAWAFRNTNPSDTRGRVTKGGILLSLHSDNLDWRKRAKNILERTGAEDVAATEEAKGDTQNTDKPPKPV